MGMAQVQGGHTQAGEAEGVSPRRVREGRPQPPHCRPTSKATSYRPHRWDSRQGVATPAKPGAPFSPSTPGLRGWTAMPSCLVGVGNSAVRPHLWGAWAHSWPVVGGVRLGATVPGPAHTPPHRG